MSKKIFIGNLPYAATSEEIQGSFSQYGEVLSTRIVTDRETGRSKGFAFVEMLNEEEADAAIAALNGAEYLGRNIVVNEARPREAGVGGGAGGSSFRPRPSGPSSNPRPGQSRDYGSKPQQDKLY